MKREYRCPLCKAVIPPDDVNVATDLALCRTCGNTSSFSIVSGSSEISLDVLANPPRCVKIERDFSEATVITYRRLSPVLLFLIPFTTFWSGLSMWGIYGSQFRKGEFDLSQSLFGLPFLFGTVVLLSIITFLLVGKWLITLKKGMGNVFVGVGSLGWSRSFTYNRDTVISMRMTNVQVNNVSQKGILIRNASTDLIFGTMLKEEAKQFIAAAIMKEVKGV
ncbi:MAG: hypothetical protein JXN60_08845 [Lentisphaerae bacterium]|nr:hypothetical protein [Lentisphaerota bacterium]